MRIYINRFDAKHIWSVDEGDTSTETNWDKVIIEVPCETRQDLTNRDSEQEPCCWLQCDGTLKEVSKRPKVAMIE